jgi:DNA-cytosine methyltransferase
MLKPTVGTYFSGGGIGLAELKGKVDFAFAAEYDPAISEVYRANISDRIITARVQDVDVTKLERVDLFQVSPVCKEFSAAKTGGKESAEELSQAAAICHYLDYHKPPYFLLENVRGYIKSKSFQMIVVRLTRLGYTCRFSVENSADYGVPQTRERLILRAALDRPLPSLPDYAGRWKGWYEAIEDLIPGLPESKFADWQLERLPQEIQTFLMQIQGEASDYLEPVKPSPTISAGHTAGKYRAFLVESKNANQEYGKGYREEIEPAFTVVTDDRPSHMPKAFLADMFNASREFTVREHEEPSFTIAASHMRRNSTIPKALIMPGANSSNENYYRYEDEPMVTIGASLKSNGAARAWLSQGRVVQMTPRALARFMSMPDWYKLPDKNGLACTVIGNGIPSRMGARIIEALLGLNDSKIAA